MTKPFGIRGCPLSGTTVLEHLLSEEHGAENVTARGKHILTMPDAQETWFITKHPVAWLVSVERFFDDIEPADIREFIIDSWTGKNRYWLDHGARHVRHQDLVEEPGEAMGFPCELPRIDLKTRDKQFDREYYLNRSWEDDVIYPDKVERLLRRPDVEELMKDLGYL